MNNTKLRIDLLQFGWVSLLQHGFPLSTANKLFFASVFVFFYEEFNALLSLTILSLPHYFNGPLYEFALVYHCASWMLTIVLLAHVPICSVSPQSSLILYLLFSSI